MIVNRACICKDDEWTRCIDGTVYTQCSEKTCPGVCEYAGDCECSCHASIQADQDQSPADTKSTYSD